MWREFPLDRNAATRYGNDNIYQTKASLRQTPARYNEKCNLLLEHSPLLQYLPTVLMMLMLFSLDCDMISHSDDLKSFVLF